MSVLEIKDLFSRPGSPAYPFRDDQGQLCWLESITEEGGRVALKQQTAGSERIITPQGYQIRSRVHEYGGKCFCLVGEAIYFNNYADGLIYCQHLHDGSAPVPVVQELPGVSGYADLVYSETCELIVAVQEVEGPQGSENLNQLVSFPISGSSPAAPSVLVAGADFYAAPCLSEGGDKIAWLQWDHPHMPWDACSLFRADMMLAASLPVLSSARRIAGVEGSSVCQPGFLASGELVFAMDMDLADDEVASSAKNYWNLYLSRGDEVTPLTQDQAEYGEAHWVFGQCRWVQISPTTLLAIATRDENDRLVRINLSTLDQDTVGEAIARLSQLSVASEKALCIAEYKDQPPQILETSISGEPVVLKALEPWLETAQLSYPELICYPTRRGAQAYANYYPAKGLENLSTIALVVLVHGGPTARADTSLKPLVQYFTQNGFAVLDVNHRGSTGHGRAYRQALLGQWGEIDADDIADAIGYACTHLGVDPARVFIRGGSAGGYAVLRALTRFPELFCGGACYYGIGNLITLAEITHKFEGRYTDRLIGESYTPESARLDDSRFRSRSPIFDIERIKSPLILFQGLDDKVVPPDVSREIVQSLERRGLRHEYIEYAGEGHGFRRAETKIDSLEHEIRFFKSILDT